MVLMHDARCCGVCHATTAGGTQGGTAGKGSLTRGTLTAQVGLLVCFDLFYPEVSRVLAVNKAR